MKLFFLIFLFTASLAYGYGEDCSREMKARVTSVLTAAEKNGWKRVNGISFDQLRNKIESPLFSYFCNRKLVVSWEGRDTAVYNRFGERAWVHVNLLTLSGFQRSVQDLSLLHESLGALFGLDKSYELSLRMQAMTKVPRDREKFVTVLEGEIDRQELAARFMEGGGPLE